MEFTRGELEELEQLVRCQPNNEMLKEHLAAQLASGLSIFYEDYQYPGCVIEELPDGRRFLLQCTEETRWENVLIRELDRIKIA
jgi:hypothetical protein